MSITLPSNWQVESLGKCCTIVSGATPRRDVPEYWDNHIPWVTPKDISNLNDPILEDTPEYISEAGYKNCSAKLLPKRSVLFSSRAPIGLVALTGREMCTNQGFKSLIPGKKVHSEYLYHCMKWMAPKIAELGNGATFKEVSKEVISRVEIPLPPLAEQKRIAAILDKADAIRRKRQAAIKLADDFLRATFLDMFGDPVTNPKGLYLATLNQLCGFIGGSSLPDGIPFTGQDGGVLLMKVGDMNSPGNEIFLDSSREWLNTPKSQNGIAPVSSIILPKRGGAISTNKKRMLLRPSLLDPNLMAIYSINNKLNPFYLFQWFNLFDLTTISNGSAVPQLNKKDLSPLKIICPPIEQQKTFERIFKTVLKLIEKMSADNPERLFNSLTQRAFRGAL